MHVTAHYRITRLGPFLERLEDVRIGDPARPDLTAKQIEVAIGYGLHGPIATGVSVTGAQLHATLDSAGLHLGAIDRLLPKSTDGATTLPKLVLSIADSRLLLDTPNGAIALQLDGTGNPGKRFAGRAVAEAPALRFASCSLGAVHATVTVVIREGRPTVSGPITIGATKCPSLSLGRGVAQVAATSSPTFEQVDLQSKLEGFGGVAGPARFASVHGAAQASGMLGNLVVRTELGLDRLALPALAKEIAHAGKMPAGLPITPTAVRASAALAMLLSNSQADADLDVVITGRQVALHVRKAALADATGARFTALARGGMLWSAGGWRLDGDVTAGGGDLPDAGLELRQSAPGASLNGTAQLASYSAGAARIALPAGRFEWREQAIRFDGRVLADGPIGDGFVRGLELPVRGRVSRTGDMVVGEGCQPIAFRSLRLAGVAFAPFRTTLCGRPLVKRSAGAPLRLDATTQPLQLTGLTTGGAPVTLDIEGTHLTKKGFEAQALRAAFGDSRLQIARLNGRLGGTIGGTYSNAGGAIANVPLRLSQADGHWAFANGNLTLSGSLQVADAAVRPRFLPLVTNDLRFLLHDGSIDATATLHDPKSRAKVGDIALVHRLADGVGHATIAVPGLAFAPKGLQPEALTPLTLGVVVDVAGSVSGSGRIDWSSAGTSSAGVFGTDHLDLAAAFGPVSGIKGQIRFTDLLGLVSAPHQEMTIAEINPGVAVANGVVHFQLISGNRVAIEDARWPFAMGALRLEPTTLDFSGEAARRLTFRVDALDAAAFIQQLDFPNLAATGRFDGALPMIFDDRGGRIEGGSLVARKDGGTLAYVGELSSAQLGTMGKLAFDALKAIRYSSLQIRFDGRLDGEMISQVNFTGVREATPDQALIARMIRNLPFRFNIRIRAPFRGLVGSARAYMDPRLLLTQPPTTPAEPAVQSVVSEPVR
ncbi:hypothetical protein FHS31_000288 [Sphingomonas vulcanisoli]|uniref:Dicarboxylate transport domain-containing protein n=1 Tax=Sphingomonas vulcanisoli TaxID=1658060 RepID=A0ABX0TMG1_9SPHN|nr:hypothetical protein [Sphingomonas vulcanisoli]